MKRVVRAFCMGLGMFTALPCPYRPWAEEDRGLMIACLPVVGTVIGLIWAVLALLGRWLLPRPLDAALIAALPFLLTGFIHLDGFMDACDALLSWRPLEERLRILKDSATGAFAVVSLAMLLLFSFAAAQAVDPAALRALALVPVVSRCGSAISVSALRPLDRSEYARLPGSAARCAAIAVIYLIAMLAGALWLGRYALALAAETLVYAAAMVWAVRTLKGVSGDLAGFALSLAETGALIALAILSKG